MTFIYGWLKKTLLTHKKEGIYGIIFVFLLGFGGDFLRHWYEKTDNNTKGRKEQAHYTQESRKMIESNHATIEHRIDHTDNLWVEQQRVNQSHANQLGVLTGEESTIFKENDRLLQQGLRDNAPNTKN